jgi:cell division protein ZapA
MEKSIQVQILGRRYPLRVREEDEQLARSVAAYVDGKMQIAREAVPNQSDTTLAVLTALSIAEELFTLREERAAANALIAEVDRLSEELNQVLHIAEDRI